MKNLINKNTKIAKEVEKTKVIFKEMKLCSTFYFRGKKANYDNNNEIICKVIFDHHVGNMYYKSAVYVKFHRFFYNKKDAKNMVIKMSPVVETEDDVVEFRKWSHKMNEDFKKAVLI